MALDLYNNPFNNFVQRNYQPQTPQNRLQTAYDQAMSRRTPEWARTVSDIMPSLAEIVAYGTTKGAFNQGRIVDSLEREKQRRTAYNQMMRENEDKQVNDYVQMAKEQLGFDMAQDDKEYARLEAQRKADEERERRIEAYNQWLDEMELKRKQQEIDNEIAINTNNLNQDKFNFDKERQDNLETQQMKENAFKDRQLNLQEKQLAQQQAQAEAKAKEEELKKNQERIFTLINNNSVTPEVGNLILNNPELMPYLKDSGKYKKPSNVLGFLPWKTGGNDNKFDFNYEQYLIDKGIPVTKNNIAEIKKQLGL